MPSSARRWHPIQAVNARGPIAVACPGPAAPPAAPAVRDTTPDNSRTVGLRVYRNLSPVRLVTRTVALAEGIPEPRADPAGGIPAEMGPYRLEWLLGEGGMGRVHLGHTRTGSAVAVKVVHRAYAADPDTVHAAGVIRPGRPRSEQRRTTVGGPVGVRSVSIEYVPSRHTSSCSSVGWPTVSVRAGSLKAGNRRGLLGMKQRSPICSLRENGAAHHSLPRPASAAERGDQAGDGDRVEDEGDDRVRRDGPPHVT